jgi:hypothetical protein
MPFFTILQKKASKSAAGIPHDPPRLAWWLEGEGQKKWVLLAEVDGKYIVSVII